MSAKLGGATYGARHPRHDLSGGWGRVLIGICHVWLAVHCALGPVAYAVVWIGTSCAATHAVHCVALYSLYCILCWLVYRLYYSQFCVAQCVLLCVL